MAVAAGSLYLGLYLSNKASSGGITFKDMKIGFSTDTVYLVTPRSP